MAEANLRKPGVPPSPDSRVCVVCLSVRLCVCVCPSCTLASCSLPSSLRPHTPVSGPARSPPDDQGLAYGAHPTQRLRQSLWDSSSIMFAAAWSRALTQGNYLVSWALYEYHPLIVLLWKSISFLTLKSRNKFSSFFKEITLTACAIFRQRNISTHWGQSGNKGHTLVW